MLQLYHREFYAIHTAHCHLYTQHLTNRRNLIIRFCIYNTIAVNQSDMFRSLVGTIIRGFLNYKLHNYKLTI
jgi:hypothetical protein